MKLNDKRDKNLEGYLGIDWVTRGMDVWLHHVKVYIFGLVLSSHIFFMDIKINQTSNTALQINE